MRSDQPLEIFDRRAAQLDPGQASELGKRDGLSRFRLAQPQSRAVESALDAVEKLDHASDVDVRLVDRAGKQRTSERSLLYMGVLGEQPQLLGVLPVEGDVQASAVGRHTFDDTRLYTNRVPGCSMRGRNPGGRSAVLPV